MAEEKINYLTETTDGNGTVTYASDVIAIIAGLATTEVEGITGMSGGITSGFAELLGRKNLTKGVKVEVGKEEAAIDINVIVDFGVAIHDVAKKVQENVKKNIETMTGLRVVEVNVNIQGINVKNDSSENIPKLK